MTDPAPFVSRRREQHPQLPEGKGERWMRAIAEWPAPLFPQSFGARFDEVRLGYARMSVPYAPHLQQPAGVVHGGVLATLLDTVVVPAIGSHYDRTPVMLTIDLQVRYLDAAQEIDLVAEGWITKRGRSIAFCQSEVLALDGRVIAQGWTTYRVIEPKDG